jgi:predicted transcriptional regulator of viral defense system
MQTNTEDGLATTLESWIDSLQASGKYSFLRAHAMMESGLSPAAVSKALQRSVKRGRIVKLKDYFYSIVPLEYRKAGGPPVSWFIRDLMAAIGLPYYTGLLSAAALHGASHHQPQEFQVMTDRSVRGITAGRTRIHFFASKYVRHAAVMDLKTPTGLIKVSTPETTVVDLIRFSRSAGRLDNVATVIAEMAPLLDPKRLLASVRVVEDVPGTQRLGYILDQIRRRNLSEPIHEWVERQKPHALPLRSGRAVEGNRENRRWHLLVNGPIEVEV